MTSVARPIASVDELFHLEPLARFEVLIAGPRFDGYLRGEPIRFESTNLIYGISCHVPACLRNSISAEWWCSRHSQERRKALRDGVGEAVWLAAATPSPPRRRPTDGRRPACRFCPDRDAAARDLCAMHEDRLRAARRSAPDLDEEVWAVDQVAFPGAGDCRVEGCLRRGEREVALCPSHYRAWVHSGQPVDGDMETWLATRCAFSVPAELDLVGLPPLVAAEIRYALWAHTQSAAPARWHPKLLRQFANQCREADVSSLTELDPRPKSWPAKPALVNRILKGMLRDVRAIHHTRDETREFGYLDTNYWGFEFPERRSAFDLSAISQRWLRNLTWDYLADQLDGPGHARTAGTFEAIRRAMVCFSSYLSDCDPHRGAVPSALTESTAREYVADLKRCVSDGRAVRGIFRVDGKPSTATPTTYQLFMNAFRRVMRWAMDSGAATTAGLSRPFVVAIPFGGATSFKNPRPFSDPVLRALSDPFNIGLLNEHDPSDNGYADMWSIQVKCGRRIGEVVKLRLDCVGEHLGRTWMWVDMTKVGKLDYAIQIPRDIYDLIRVRQAKSIERFRLRHGVEPTAKQQRLIALFPSPVTNPSFERSISPSRFAIAFKDWLESDKIDLPGHTTHQARHTLATRLVQAGASMTHVKQVLGHVSERMGDSYVLIAGSQVEPFLQQVWVTGPGNATPGRVVLTPTDAETTTAERLMVDLAAIPTEHGLCTFKPVVGGFECPFDRKCDSCEHFVITGADYVYWKRLEERWSTLAEGAPDDAARDYIYATFEKSSQAVAGLEKALLALGLLDEALELDLRSPHQDFFNPIWTSGWRAGDLVEMGGGVKAITGPDLDGDVGAGEAQVAS